MRKEERGIIVVSVAGGIASLLTFVSLVLFICAILMGQEQMLLVSIGCISFAICLYAISIAKFIFIAIDIAIDMLNGAIHEEQ